MADWKRALASGISGGASVYGEQQKAIRINKADQIKKEAEYERKEHFAKYGKVLDREEQVIGRTGQGVNVYAGDALQKDYKETEGFRSTEDIEEGKMDSGMFYQGKKLTNNEYAALDPKAREEAQTTEEWMKSKAEITKREYTTAGDARLKNLKEALAAGEISPEEYKTAIKSSLGVTPKSKGFTAEAKSFDKALTTTGYANMGEEEGAATLVAAQKQAAVTNPKYGGKLAKRPIIAKAMSKDLIGKKLVSLANSDFGGDIDKAAAELLKRKGGGELAASKIKAAISYVNTNYSIEKDKGKWYNPFDTTETLGKN